MTRGVHTGGKKGAAVCSVLYWNIFHMTSFRDEKAMTSLAIYSYPLYENEAKYHGLKAAALQSYHSVQQKGTRITNALQSI